MCLIPKHKNAKIAKRNIICYKLLFVENDDYFSVVQNYRWEPDRLVTVKIIKKHEEINEGLHAYRTLLTARQSIYLYKIIKKVVIPKGSEYYLGKDGDIVSNQMMLL
jgi:hypothetical protein